MMQAKFAAADKAKKEAEEKAKAERAEEQRQAEEAALADDYACIAYQGAYTQELIDETDYPSFDIEAANKAFYEWKKYKKKGIMEFRNHGHVSPMTGTKAPAHHTVWADALDDSLENYLKGG